MNYTIPYLIENDGFVCKACGKRHYGKLRDCEIGKGAVKKLPVLIRKYGANKAFVLCDRETYAAAGKLVCEILDSEKIPYTLHIITRTHPAPDEKIVGEAVMYCDADCDCVVAVGGGVINDTCKILAVMKKVPDIIVGTAPSMDGFASASSSMDRSGLKVSLASKCPDAVIGDSDIISAAPKRMICSGIGDMLAKYVSLIEWKIANLLLGEYFCPEVAGMVENALDVCIKASEKAVSGDPDACAEVMRGLVVSGLAMNYAGLSRPASGMEHYISHIIDMRALEFGTPCDFHGIQAGLGTLVTVRAYDKLMEHVPSKEKALSFVESFSLDDWFSYLREKLGHGAEAIIAGENREHKYDKQKHGERLEKIIENWDAIKEIISALPSSDELCAFMKKIGHPTKASDIGLTENDLHEAFLMAKDIRDKYVLGRLLWDLGILE